MKHLVIFLFLLLISCSPCLQLNKYHNNDPEENIVASREIPIYVDADFPYAQKVSIQRAIVEMNHVLNGFISLKLMTWEFDPSSPSGIEIKNEINKTDDGILLIAVNENDPVLVALHQDGGNTLAFVDSIGNKVHHIVVIQDRIGHKNFHKIILHEFGHALGAVHVNAESLMFPYVGPMQQDCVDKITMLQIANYQHLDPAHMNYCSIKNLP